MRLICVRISVSLVDLTLIASVFPCAHESTTLEQSQVSINGKINSQRKISRTSMETIKTVVPL